MTDYTRRSSFGNVSGRGFDSPRLHPASLVCDELRRMPSVASAKEGLINIMLNFCGSRIKMKYVYLLESVARTDKRYIGITSDLNRRIKEHNSKKSPHTAKYAPWKIVLTIRFENDCKAESFEKYLKSGSGHAFAKRHFW